MSTRSDIPGLISLDQVRRPRRPDEQDMTINMIKLVMMIAENDGPYRSLLQMYLFSLSEKHLGLVNGAMQAGRDVIYCGIDSDVPYNDLARTTDMYAAWCIPGMKANLIEYMISKKDLANFLEAYLRQRRYCSAV